MISWEQLYNPFGRTAGWQAFIFGLAGMTMAGVIASITGVHFTGLFSAISTVSLGWHVPFAEMALTWLPLTFFGVIYCQFFGSRNYRVIDVIGTLTFSRIPYLLISFTGFLRWAPIGQELTFALAIAILIIAFAWTLALTYHALGISGNLKKERLWIGLLTVNVLGQIVYIQFINKIYLLIL